jgi:hypothetical protein
MLPICDWIGSLTTSAFFFAMVILLEVNVHCTIWQRNIV